jgi:hypothetical protein
MKSDDKKMLPSVTETEKQVIVIYQSADGKINVDCRLESENIWLTQAQIAKLFGRDVSVVSRHIKNTFAEGELNEKMVIAEFAITTQHGAMKGKSQEHAVKHYNLDVALAVGYRVKSPLATQFRQWATAVVREYLQKGFVMNDDFLKNMGGGLYWKELLERIRDIRSSEKVFYRQVLDLYATSLDYDPRTPESHEFFKIVQNKIHYAAHGHTAAEVIAERADAELPFMGLTVFSGGKLAKSEIGIAKNYLTEDELAVLNRMVSAFFDLAELRAIQHQPMYMRDWILELDDFAKRYGKGVLPSAGTVSHQTALEKATAEYEKYRDRTIDELSSVERDFLASIKDTQKKLESKKNRGKKDMVTRNDKNTL